MSATSSLTTSASRARSSARTAATGWAAGPAGPLRAPRASASPSPRRPWASSGALPASRSVVTYGSMNAAWTTLPVVSITLASAGIGVDPAAPTASMTPPRMTTTPGSKTRAGRRDHASARQGVAGGRGPPGPRRKPEGRAGREQARRSAAREGFFPCGAGFYMLRRRGPAETRVAARVGQEDTMIRKASILGISLLLAGAALATAQDRPPLSPAGTASALVGAKWAPGQGRRHARRGRQVARGQLQPAEPSRPDEHLRFGRRLRQDRDGATASTGGREPTRRRPQDRGSPDDRRQAHRARNATPCCVELKEPAWTLILSSQPSAEKFDDRTTRRKLYATSNYDPKFDVVRVPMTMVTPAVSIDQFTIGFVDMTDRAASSRWSGRRPRASSRSRSPSRTPAPAGAVHGGRAAAPFPAAQ